MRLPKKYGQSKIESCPFCGKTATATNKQGFPVCRDHRSAVMNEMKCACGEHLEVKNGKYGVFFLCMNCGPVNVRKVFEMNEVRDVSGEIAKNEKKSKASALYNKAVLGQSEWRSRDDGKKSVKKSHPKEITITPDDVEYFS